MRYAQEANDADPEVEPSSTRRYDPREFHVGMFNEWTNAVCEEHNHVAR